MSNRLYPILITVGVMLIGFIIKRYNISVLIKRKNTTIDYANQFISLANYYMENNSIGSELYAVCIHDVDMVQKELGQDGVISEFIDRLKGVSGTNYQLLINTLLEMRGMASQLNNIIIRERIGQMIQLCEDALRRHIGNLDRGIERSKRGLFNPFTCFALGIRWIIGIPFDILYWCGIINTNSKATIHENAIYRFIGKLFTLIGLLGSIITIVLGWDQFITLFGL